MPKNSTVIIDCQIAKMSEFATYNSFFYWGAAKTYIIKASSEQKISYYVATNDFQCQISAKKPISQLILQPFSGTGTFTVTFDDGTVSSASRGNWVARTTPLQMRLQPNVYVKRVRQINTGDVLVHDLTPDTQNDVPGMYDAVDGTFYPYSGGNAYIVDL